MTTIKVIKSRNDSRNYEHYVLSNKLKVLVVQDNNANVCAASLVVGVGQIDDTTEGIAHFLEHMLFMGCEEYPSEDAFMEFITKFGGETNAFTADTRTNYHFSIDSSSFMEGLKMFSGFFVAPLLLKDSVSREMHAVDSEHVKYMQDDMWRTEEIKKKLYINKHPYAKFSIGNLETLNKPHVHDVLRDFYHNKYSSHLMNLVVFVNGDIDIDKLDTQIINTFGKIKLTNSAPPREFGPFVSKMKVLKYVPVMDVQLFTLLFEVPSFAKTPKMDPYSFICHIVGHEGDNSIHKILSDQGWLSALYAGIENTLDDVCTFEIRIKLSEEGFTHTNDIIRILFEYLNNFKKELGSNLTKLLYDENKVLTKIMFDNWEKTDPISSVISLADTLMNKYIDPTEILALSTLTVNYDEILENLTKALNSLTPQNCSLLIGNQKYANKLGNYEHYFNIEYFIEDWDPDFLAMNSYDTYKLPPINQYIPSSTQLITRADSSKPVTIRNDRIVGIYNFNSSFGTATTEIKVRIELPTILKSAEQYVRTLLYLNALYSDNNAFVYTVGMAKYLVGIALDYKALIISIEGYTDKINLVVEKLISLIVNQKIRDIAFKSAKEELRETYANFPFMNPINKLQSHLLKQLLEKSYTEKECMNELDGCTLENSREAFLKTMELSNILVFVSGNITEEHALQLINMFDEIDKKFIKILYDPPLASRHDVRAIINKTIVTFNSENPSDKNSAIRYLVDLCRYRSGVTSGWEKAIAFANLIKNMLSNEYFDQLRTKEQLGYIVGCKLNIIGDPYLKNVFLEFVVQSPKKDPLYLTERTDKFLLDVCEKLKKLSDNEFSSYKDGTRVEYIKPFYNLSELNSYYWTQMLEGTFIYDKKDIICNALDKLSKDDIIDMAKLMIVENKKVFVCGLKA